MKLFRAMKVVGGVNMTTADAQIRSAWASPDPRALDAAAETLAAAGVDEASILDALDRLLSVVRAAGADDETEERIMGVMDRLTGWCHVSNHIRTERTAAPPQPTVTPSRG